MKFFKKRAKFYGIGLILLIFLADIANVLGNQLLSYKDLYIQDFYADKYKADVGEPITFTAIINAFCDE
ncbi:MAG: hypothetical protein ACTSPW_10065 [Promethearchaeota archaeon]